MDVALRRGHATPDLAVDGHRAEIKSSTKGNVRAFGGRIADVRLRQGTGRVYINSVRSLISSTELFTELQAVVDHGDATYIRIIGSDVDQEYGRWV